MLRFKLSGFGGNIRGIVASIVIVIIVVSLACSGHLFRSLLWFVATT